MEIILCVAFCSFIVGIAVGATLVYCFLSATDDKILENNKELCDIVGETLKSAIDYGREVKLFEEKLKKEYLDICKGGVVPPNKQ